MSNSGSYHRGRKHPAHKISVVSMRRRASSNMISCRTLQLSKKPITTNLTVPSDILLEGQVRWLETVLPFSPQTFSAHGVMLSRDRLDIVTDYILLHLFVPYL